MFIWKEDGLLEIGYNVVFQDTRDDLPIRMNFEETVDGSEIFFPLPDAWTRHHEILHNKNDPRSSNRGVAFLSISPADHGES
jgi:hypothetical protein